MMILHIGCGVKKVPSAVGIDIDPASEADIIHDLDRFPYPLDTNSFDLIVCDHVLEHLDNIVRVIEELHRVGKPGARIEIRVPHYSSVYAFSDPTHRHFFSSHSFDYFLADTPVRQFHYSHVLFRSVHTGFPPPEGAGQLKKLVFTLINKHIDFYEKRLAFIMPRHLLYFELEIVK